MSKMTNSKFLAVALQVGGAHYPEVGGELLEKFATELVRQCAGIAFREDHDPGDCILKHFDLLPGIITAPASSPDRGTFQKAGYIQRTLEAGKSLDDPEVQHMIKFYDDWQVRATEQEADPAWRQQNLEWDLRTTDWVIDKCRSDGYAQNLYAAMCNMQWQKREVLPILKDQYWSCSWRSAGGIVADLQGKGDYIDWYCSGMGGLSGSYDPEGSETFEQWQARTGYVGEGTVTDEIANDMYILGWVPSEWKDQQL